MSFYRPLFIILSVIFVVSATWWATAPHFRADNARADQPTLSGWDRTRLPGNVDLFTLISSKTEGRDFYELSGYDQKLYRRIFQAQADGNWSQANALMRRLHNDVLVGHLLYDRYIRATNYRASYSELRDWMIRYGDHPEAYKVYQLAQKRRNNDPAALPAPQIAKKLLGSLELSWFKADIKQQKAAKPTKRDERHVRDLMAQIKANLSKDRVTTAYNLLGKSKTSSMLTATEYDSLLSQIAAGYYYNGKFKTAQDIALQAVKRSDKAVPIAHWIAGLSSWQLKDYKSSAKHFQAVTASYSRNPWMLSAGAFWASRSYDALGRSNESNDWLQEAASYPRTFYGLVAMAKLGNTPKNGFSWDEPPLTSNLIAVIKENKAGKRALALLDIGQNTLAEQELRQVHPNGNKRLEKALIAAANHFKLPQLAMNLGNAINQPNGNLYDAALYPVVPWKGDESTGIDPALTNALIRQESRFDANARNGRSGAQGLMQLMPRTAKFMSDASYDAKDLHNPEVNIVLGQRYIRYLLGQNHIKGNLVYLAAAYNAGPGNLLRWKKTIEAENDPFLFIESIPISETRAFVERVLTNYWVYRARFGQEASSLVSLSNGQWPVYKTESDIKLASY